MRQLDVGETGGILEQAEEDFVLGKSRKLSDFVDRTLACTHACAHFLVHSSYVAYFWPKG